MKALLLLLLMSCSSAQLQKTKAHAVEVGFAGAGGAGWVLAGGPAGPFIFVGMSVLGICINEAIQPPDDVLVIDRDDKGKITKTTRYHPKEKTGNPTEKTGLMELFADFTYTSLKWIAVFAIAMILLKAIFGARYRDLIIAFLKEILTSLKLLLTFKPVDAAKSATTAMSTLAKASGMKHSK